MPQAATGAGIGGGAQAASRPQQVRVESEALLSFRLESPITVMPVSSLQRPRNDYSGGYNAPPSNNNYNAPPSSNDNDIIDYSDDSNRSSDPNRPVLRRRPGTTDQSSNNPPE